MDLTELDKFYINIIGIYISIYLVRKHNIIFLGLYIIYWYLFCNKLYNQTFYGNSTTNILYLWYYHQF